MITRKRKFWSALSKNPTMTEMIIKAHTFGLVFEFDIR